MYTCMYNKYIKTDNKKKPTCILCKYNNNETFCIFKKERRQNK